ncbi:protein TonB [Rhizobium mesoamericanum]|uniref:TonB family protein n=1 Tax=Rhizobium mesoamericanum TaxID=1079800 RepID=UPI0027803D5F|nr:TonB family protein [Rhizobium mesoamericanum]MDQ0563823.1 protein TonB [Rhizobium mesoamericanum]
MAVSAKSKSRIILVEEPVANNGMNDNTPDMHPGHELSDLCNVPRQPSAEAVIHYARLALIESFPQDPRSASSTVLAAPAMDASVKKDECAKLSPRNVVIACLSSFGLHAILVVALVLCVAQSPQEPIEEAGDAVSVVILGDSNIDQAAAGKNVDEPQPEQIAAETIQAQTVQPTVGTPTKVEPAEPVVPAQEVTRVSSQSMVVAEPEVLTSLSPAETSVVQPMTTELPSKTAPAAQATPEGVFPVQPVETAVLASGPDKPMSKPEPKSEARVKKPIEKREPPKKAKQAAGSGGENKQDSKEGLVEGTETATSSQNSSGAANSGGAGSAAVANYPSKVRSRILRALRVPSALKREPASVLLRLTIVSSGALSSVRVARSSGNLQLDQVTVDAVQRAAPFQPLPEGKPVWSFTLPFQVGPR